jgi:hypothetical protein
MFEDTHERYSIFGNRYHINSFLSAPPFLYISLSDVIKQFVIHFVDCLINSFVFLSQIFSQLNSIMSNTGKFVGTETNKR